MIAVLHIAPIEPAVPVGASQRRLLRRGASRTAAVDGELPGPGRGIPVGDQQAASYVNLYRGYVELDKYRVYDSLGQQEEAEVSNAAALVAKESVYLTYKEKYPHDTFMIRQLGQEYCRSQAERMDFITDVTEKVVIKKTLRSFLSKLDKDNGRQHIIL